MPEKKKECPSCALDVDADAEVCPYCGYEYPVQKPAIRYAAVLMVLLLLGWLFGYLF